MSSILKNELETLRENRPIDNDWFDTAVPEKLPAWITRLPVGKENLFFWGISDPGMDEEKGHNQAIMRMIYLHALATNSTLGLLTDIYSQDDSRQFSNAYVEFTEFSSQTSLTADHIDIVHAHRTRYKETVLLGKIKHIQHSDHKSVTTTVKAGFLIQLNAVDTRQKTFSKLFIESRHEDTGQDDRTVDAYTAYAMNDIVHAQSTINNQLINTFSTQHFRYLSSHENPNDMAIAGSNTSHKHHAPHGIQKDRVNHDDIDVLDTPFSGYSLRNGLWHAYLMAFLLDIAQSIQGKPIHISATQDAYNQNIQSIDRGYTEVSVYHTPGRIQIINNQLSLSPAWSQ